MKKMANDLLLFAMCNASHSQVAAVQVVHFADCSISFSANILKFILYFRLLECGQKCLILELVLIRLDVPRKNVFVYVCICVSMWALIILCTPSEMV